MSESQLLNISSAALRRAANIREQIEELEQEYQQILAGGAAPVRRGPEPEAEQEPKPKGKPGPKPKGKPGPKPKGKPGPKPKGKPGPKPGSKKKRAHSEETRMKIAAAAKARWAKKRASN